MIAHKLSRRWLQARILLVGVAVILSQLVHDVVLALASALVPAGGIRSKYASIDAVRYLDAARWAAAAREERARALHALSRVATEDENEEIAPLGVTVRSLPLTRVRRVGIGFEVAGKAGQVVNVCVTPYLTFRGTKIIATDDSSRPGGVTRVGSMFVGNEAVLGQLPMRFTGISSTEFAYDQCNNDFNFPTCAPGTCIVIQVAFVEDGVWNAALFGDALS